MIKNSGNKTPEELELQKRLLAEREYRKQFKDYHLEIEDLQEVEVLEKRRNLGKGELTSMIFAKKTRQAFLTDDKKAREIAEQVITDGKVQTTPHLLGWLFYQNILIDSDKAAIIEEHSKFRKEKRGNLSKFFNNMYKRAYEYQLMNRCS
jgi:predicted nucleic acid-binding protein